MRSAVLVVTIALSAGSFLPAASAFQGGLVGFSGKGNQTCGACHTGGTVPEEVRFEGPTQVVVGATATFRFVVVSEAPSQDEAGFNVAASAGLLRVIAGQGARLVGNELTHTGPKDIDDNDEAAWEFNWIAPTAPGEQTLFGAGNAVNGNGNTLGDRSRATTFKIQVVGGSGTPTPTATPTTAMATPTHTASHTATVISTATGTAPPSVTSTGSATMTSTPTAIDTPTMVASSPTATPSSTDALTMTPTATPTPPTAPVCVGDCDGNRRVSVAELVTGVNIALDRSPVSICAALDRDSDQRVTVAELVDAVSRALRGCRVLRC